MTNRTFMTVEEVAAELGVSKSYAYKIVKQLNDELVRDFERLFYSTGLYVPIKNGNIDFELIRNFIIAQKKLLTIKL